MADDLTRIRDQFIEQATELGVRIVEKPPAKGYRYTADIFDGEKRIGRLYMRKTTVSWKAAGARSVVRLSGSEDVAGLLGKRGEKPKEEKAEKDEQTATEGRSEEEPEASEEDESRGEMKETPPEESKKVDKKVPQGEAKDEDSKEPDKKTIPEKQVTDSKPGTGTEPESGDVEAESEEAEGKREEEDAPAAAEEVTKPVSSLSRAVSEFKSGNFEKAIQWAKLSLAENPQSAAAKDILHRSERLFAEKQKSKEPTVKPGMERPSSERKPTEERVVSEPKTPGEEKKSPATTDHRPQTEPPGRKTEPAAKTPPPKIKARPESAAPGLPPKKPARGARIPLWAVVAFIGLVTAVVYLWPGNRNSGDVTRDERSVTALPEPTVDPKETLEIYIAELEANVRDDTTGISTANLMRALIELGALGDVDTTTMNRITALSYRADSLAVHLCRRNKLASALSFLEEAHDGWTAMQRFSGGDSLPEERLTWNSEYQQVITVREELLGSMVHIPAGSFTRGSNRGAFDSRPASEIVLSPFYISRYEITNRQYWAFLFDTGTPAPTAANRYQRPYGWSDLDFPDGKGNHPVVLVKWNDGNDFAEWLGGSLPSEAQWEKAARGTDGRHYPWGNRFHADSLVCREGRDDYSAAGFKPGDVSPMGVHDMAGGVREWVQDWYGSDYYLTGSSRRKDPTGPRRGRFRVVRGASWRTEGVVNGLTHARENAAPWTRNRDLGFRVVMPDSIYDSIRIPE